MELTKRQLENIKYELDSDIFKLIKLVNNSKFNLGDILIRRYRDDYDEDANEWSLYDGSNMKKRFKVTHIDEDTGVAFAQEYNRDGKLLDQMICTIDSDVMDDYGYSYTLDPLYVDATILQHEFHIQDLFDEDKKRSEEILANKKKLIMKFKNNELRDFFLNLKPGDEIYFQHDKSANSLKSDHAVRKMVYEGMSAFCNRRAVGRPRIHKKLIKPGNALDTMLSNSGIYDHERDRVEYYVNTQMGYRFNLTAMKDYAIFKGKPPFFDENFDLDEDDDY